MEKELKVIEEDIDKSNPAYFENKEKELRQQESEIVERLVESIINGGYDFMYYLKSNGTF